jgi:exodeoxyribonuclease VII small subunit
MSGKKKEPSFELALDQLEALVREMESGEVPLADMVAKFEQGTKLIKTCEERLRKAELTIENLRAPADPDAADPAADSSNPIA